jgi:HemK-related putative methylase
MMDITAGNHSISIKPLSGAMDPSPYTEFLSRNIMNYNINKVQSALDLGCGSGALAILLAKRGVNNVYATDINPSAIEATKLNAELNDVKDDIEIVQADMLSFLAGTGEIDLIVSNPPSLPMKEEPDTDYHMYNYYGGSKGRDFIEELVSQSANCLQNGGDIMFINTSLADVGATFKQLPKEGFRSFAANCTSLKFRDQYYEYFDWFKHLKDDGIADYYSNNEEHYETLYCITATYSR